VRKQTQWKIVCLITLGLALPACQGPVTANLPAPPPAGGEAAVVEPAVEVNEEVSPVEPEAVSAPDEAVSAPDEAVVVAAEPTAVEVIDTAENVSVEAVAVAPGPSAEQAALLASLKVWGQPPELNNEIWLNSAPLKLADLRGKVVLVEFWTFG
jgi:hypothetical protein